MERYGAPQPADNPPSIESCAEMEHKLNSLRALVCDLLKTNQELRLALLEVRSGAPDNQNS
jgi:hypothetical protein